MHMSPDSYIGMRECSTMTADLVFMKPGLIELTRILCEPNSHARLRVICRIALLEE